TERVHLQDEVAGLTVLIDALVELRCQAPATAANFGDLDRARTGVLKMKRVRQRHAGPHLADVCKGLRKRDIGSRGGSMQRKHKSEEQPCGTERMKTKTPRHGSSFLVV